MSSAEYVEYGLDPSNPTSKEYYNQLCYGNECTPWELTNLSPDGYGCSTACTPLSAILHDLETCKANPPTGVKTCQAAEDE